MSLEPIAACPDAPFAAWCVEVGDNASTQTLYATGIDDKAILAISPVR
jgi:hypothetical protein